MSELSEVRAGDASAHAGLLREALAEAIYRTAPKGSAFEEDPDRWLAPFSEAHPKIRDAYLNMADSVLSVLAERGVSDEEIKAALKAWRHERLSGASGMRAALEAARRVWLEGHKK